MDRGCHPIDRNRQTPKYMMFANKIDKCNVLRDENMGYLGRYPRAIMNVMWPQPWNKPTRSLKGII